MSLETNGFEFGEFRLDKREKVLFRDGQPVPITPKAFQLLLTLVENRGHIKKKDELMKAVWADSFVEEGNLSYTIRLLRKALSDEKEKPRYIETVPRRGYRFIAEVTVYSEPNKNSNVVMAAHTLARVVVGNGHGEHRSGNGGLDLRLEDRRATRTGPAVAMPQKLYPVVWRHRLLAATGCGVLLIGAIVLWYFSFNRAAFNFQPGQIIRLTSSGTVKTVVVSPDGKFVIYSQEEKDEQQSLWMQHIGSESSVQIAPPANIQYHSLNISPDGGFLYYIDAEGSLYRMAVLGSQTKKLADGLRVIRGYSLQQIGISPNGEQIAFVRDIESVSTLFIANADGTNERTLVSFDPQIAALNISAWSPDGKVIASLFRTEGLFNLFAVQVAYGTFAPILPQGWNSIDDLNWMPDSMSLLVTGTPSGESLDVTQAWQISYPAGERRRITNDASNYSDVQIPSDGRFFSTVKTEEIAHVWTMQEGDTSGERQLTAGFEKFDGMFALGWTPDGAIIYDTIASGKSSSWIIGNKGNDSLQLAKDVSPDAISPDGRYLVYQKLSPDQGYWLMDLKNGSEKQLTKEVSVWAAFSPDGRWVVYTGYGDRVALWKVSIEGAQAIKLLEQRATCPAVSPDGRMIAVVLSRKRVALVSFDDGKLIKTFNAEPETSPRYNKQTLQWTPDGRAINYIARNQGVSNIWRQPIDGSPPVQVTNFETGRIFNFAYSPDGKQLALSHGSVNSDVVIIKNAE